MIYPPSRHSHQDPAFRGYWKLNSAGERIQYIKDPEPRIKRALVIQGIVVWSFCVLCVVVAIILQVWGLRI